MPVEELSREPHDQVYTTEEYSFDELAKGLATSGISRRPVLRLLGVAEIPGSEHRGKEGE